MRMKKKKCHACLYCAVLKHMDFRPRHYCSYYGGKIGRRHCKAFITPETVSYTHLTLPTIYSV